MEYALTEHDTPLIGHVTDIAGDLITATLRSRDRTFQPSVLVAGEEVTIGQLGTHVLIRQGNNRLLAQVLRMWEESGSIRKLALLPLGELTETGRFTRGVHRFPVTGAEVLLTTARDTESMFERFTAGGLDLGRLSNRPDLKVFLDPDTLFTRHLAILGQSGAGKSWTVASLLQRAVKVMPRAHVVLLDLHGEYGWRDTEGRLHSAFPEHVVRHVDARELEIPYWLLTYSELVDLLVDRTDPNASVHIAFLREALYALRRKANMDLAIDRLSVDSPVYFSIKELYLHCKKANEHQLDFGKTQGPLFGLFDEFLVRFQALFNDARYDFLFRPKKRTESLDLEGLLRDFIGLGEPKRQITVIDLSPVPSDVRPTVSAQIGRLAFEFNYWNPRRREFPILLVCEEAHQYLPRESDTQHAGTRRAMERIAKEGRKYGVGLCVVSQRPTELSETVLAQCGNYICLRLTNPDDQAYVRRLLPEGEQNLAEVLTTLRRGEALAVGEAAPMPTRFQIYPPDPPPASSDAPIAESWRTGPEDLDVGDIVSRWWNQRR
jgi:DNA helicase HerA-like ATPase